MNNRYIYIVGKPSPGIGYIESIHSLGYKAGILLDSHVGIKNQGQFDRIELVDFSKFDKELSRLADLNLMAAGFVCTYENYIVSKAKIGQHFGVPTIGVESAKISTDKLLMRQALKEKDPTITPQFKQVDSLDQALEFASQHGYPLIIKPTNLVKSLLVLKCSNEQELIKNFDYAQSSIKNLYEKFNIYGRDPRIVIEGFITGKACSIVAFVDESGVPHFCEGITDLTTAQEIGVDDNYLYSRLLPTEIDEGVNKELFEVAKKGIEALSLRSTPAHIELIYNGHDVKLIEIGARIGGYRPRMYKYSYGTNLIEQEVRLSIGEKTQLDSHFTAYCAVYELFPNKEGNFQGIEGINDTSAFTYYSVKAKPDQLVGPAKNGYKAAAIIIVVNDNPKKFKSICDSVDSLSVMVA